MSRKLILLNLGLLAILVAGLMELRRQVRVAGERHTILESTDASRPASSYPEPAPPASVRPGDHMPVVERLLFSKDRNPIIEVEEPPAPEPVKRPDFPRLVGVLQLGEGPIALMAPDADTNPKPVALGETVGEYLFRSTTGDKITLEWQGQSFVVSQDELMSAKESTKATKRAVRRSEPPRRSATSSSPNVTAAKENTVGGKYNIGKEIRPGVHRADPRDPAPDGTEYQGYVKRVRKTPFGRQAWWEQKGGAKEGR